MMFRIAVKFGVLLSAAIIVATSLARPARPPFIIFGLPSMALALAVASPAAFAVLTRPTARSAPAS